MRLSSVLSAVAPPVCVACWSWAGAAEPLCGVCRGRLRWLGGSVVDEVWAPVAYDGPARAVVGALKFRGAWRAAEAMAAAVVASAPDSWLLRDAVLVPAPLHPARRRSRGFNQAERLAAAVAARTGLPVADVLARSGSRATQMGRSRAERLTAQEGTVSVTGVPVPSRVVLIDDVVTTGATLAACSAALMDAGAVEVRAVAYARTPGR